MLKFHNNGGVVSAKLSVNDREIIKILTKNLSMPKVSKICTGLLNTSGSAFLPKIFISQDLWRGPSRFYGDFSWGYNKATRLKNDGKLTPSPGTFFSLEALKQKVSWIVENEGKKEPVKFKFN